MGEAFITRRGGGGGPTALNFKIENGTMLPKSKSKNLLPYPFYNSTSTVSGVTFTDNGDGTVTAEGTCTASNYSVFRCIGTINMQDPRQRLLQPGTYTLSGCPAGGSADTYKMEVLASVDGSMLGVDTGEGVTFTLTEETIVRVNIVVVAGATVSGLVFTPQMESGSTKTDFVRYEYEENTLWVNSEYEIKNWDFDAEAPAKRSTTKNLLCYPYYNTAEIGSDKLTINGITYTGSTDGSVTATGTATDGAYFRVNYTSYTSNLMRLPKGTYTLSGCPAGGHEDTYAIEAYCYTNPAIIYRDTGEGVTFTLEEDTDVRVAILIKTGTTVNGHVFKPQLERGASATDFVLGTAKGQLWVKVGEYQHTKFNAITGNTIEVYPIAAKQLIGKEWELVQAFIFQNGKWYEWPSQYIVKDGTVVPNKSIVAYAYRPSTSSSTAKAPTISYDVNYSGESIVDITLTGTESNATGGSVFLDGPVDLTLYNKIVVDNVNSGTTGTTSTHVRMIVADSLKDKYTVVSAIELADEELMYANSKLSLDVSELTGEYYIGFNFYGRGEKYVSFTDWWLE